MSRFEGYLCPVCKKKFGGDDDIAVCPECGTPHHRECFLKDGKCAMEELHAFYEWHGILPRSFTEGIEEEAGTQPDTENSDPAASDELPAESSERDNAGSGETDPAESGENIEEAKARLLEDILNIDFSGLKRKEPPLEYHIQQELDKLFEINMLNDEDDTSGIGEAIRYVLGSQRKGLDGVSMLELTFFTVVSLSHYSVPFSRFVATRKPVYFNMWSALLLPVHQFFRKMDGWGTLLLTMITAVGLTPRILYVYGILSELAFNRAMIGARVFPFILMVLMFFFGDKIYYKHAVRRIRKMQKRFGGKTDNSEYYLALKDDGGTSIGRAIIGILALVFCIVLVHYLPLMLI